MGKYSSDSDSSRGNRRSRKSKRSRSSSTSSSASNSYSKKSYKQKKCRQTTRPCSKSQYAKILNKHSHYDPSRKNLSCKDPRTESKISRSNSRECVRSKSSKQPKSRSSSKHRLLSHTNDKSKCRSKTPSSEKFSGESPDSRPHTDQQVLGTEDQLQAKLHKAMKAAQSADNQLRQQGLLSSSTGSSVLKEEYFNVAVSTLPESLDDILDEINDSQFFQKYFTSSKAVSQESLEQPTADILLVPNTCSLKLIGLLENPGSTFHSQLLVDPELKFDKWIKKLFHLRQKAINGEPLP